MWAALILFAVLPSSTLAFYSVSDAVIELDGSSFKDKIRHDSGIWLVEFYAPWCGHCKSLAPIWMDAAAALQGILHVASVDAEEHKSLAGDFGIEGFPSIKLISANKQGKLISKEYKGERSAAAIVEWGLVEAKRVALERIGVKRGKENKGKKNVARPPEDFYGPDSDVVILTDTNFHQELDGESVWLVEFYAPWCGHCKNLKPEWDELATNVKGKAKIGAVDCTINKATCQEFGVESYPTLKYFGEDKESPSGYQGGRDSSSLTQFILGEWRKFQPPPEAKQLVDQHTFEKECIGDDEGAAAKRLCFLAFIPGILDSKAAGRNAYIKVLTRLAEKYAERPFSYLWMEGASQPALEEALGVGGYGYPAFVALNPESAKFANLRESFDQKNIIAFIEQLRTGFERVQSMSCSIPDIVSTAAWDGEEGRIIEDDEFSLEDLMSVDESSDRKDEF